MKVLCVCIGLGCLAIPAFGQCEEWIPTPGRAQIGIITDLKAVDHDGAGPASPRLYVALTPQGGEPPDNNSMRWWDGLAWRPVTAFTFGARKLLPLDQGAAGISAGKIVVAGAFTLTNGTGRNVGTWDGSTFATLGPSAAGDFSSNPQIRAMTTWDPDGPGPLEAWVVVAGVFSRFGGVNVTNIAAWNGTAWVALGTGLLGQVESLVSYDADGDGPGLPVLVAARTAGGGFVSQWNGTSWLPVGTDFNGPVNALTLHDFDGDGPELPSLCAGGDFASVAGGPIFRAARWNGTTWTQIGTDLPLASAGFNELRSLDPDGPGPTPTRLVGVGRFGSTPAGPNTVVMYDGTSWRTTTGNPDPTVAGATYVATAFDPDGPGPRGVELVAAGNFTRIGGFTGYSYLGAAAWDGVRWGPFGNEIVGAVNAFHEHDHDGDPNTPPEIYACGTFTAAGGNAADSLARWDGSRFVGLGVTNSQIPRQLRQLATFDPDGPGGQAPWLVGCDLSTSGSTPKVVRWNGTAWVAVGNPSGLQALSIIVFDEDGAGPGLARMFLSGTLNASPVQVWTGTTWATTGPGIIGTSCMRLFPHDPDGPGPLPERLHVISDQSIMSWNGATWTDIVPGTVFFSNQNTVHGAISWTFDDREPTAPEIIAGVGSAFTPNGSFNGPPAFDGSTWRLAATITGGANGRAIYGFDPDDEGPIPPQLFFGYGQWNNRGVQRYMNHAWIDMGAGLSNTPFVTPPQLGARALIGVDPDGDGPLGKELWLGGGFTHANNQPAAGFARWRLIGVPPSFVEHPASVESVCLEQVGVTVVDQGDGPRTLQWQVEDAQFDGGWRNLVDGPLVIAGQTVATVMGSTSLSAWVHPILAFGDRRFRCVVTGPCGSASSRPATVTALPCCASDFDHDGHVNGMDVSAFMNAWFDDLANNTLETDVDGSQEVNSNDVSTFLNQWFMDMQNGDC